MYTLQYELSDEDYLAFNIYHNFTVPENKKRLNRQRFLYPLAWIGVFVVLSLIYGNFDPLWDMAFPLLIVSLLWIFLYMPAMKLYVKRSVARMKKSGKLPYDRDITVAFEENYFFVQTAQTESRTGYAAIERVFRGNRAFYLYEDVMRAFILPYRAFDNEEQKEAFYQFILEKMEKRTQTVTA